MPLSDVIKVEMAWGYAPNDPAPAVWTDLTPAITNGKIGRGRSGVFDLYGPGTMELNFKAGHPGVAPTFDIANWYRHTQIRARFIGGGDNIPLFTGYIDDVDHDATRAPMAGFTKVTAQDITGLLSNVEHKDDADLFGTEIEGFPHAGTLAALITFAMTRIGLPVTLDAGRYDTLAPIALPDDLTGNVWALITSGLETEHGTLQVGAQGVLYLNGRQTPWAFGAPTCHWVDNAPDATTFRYLYRRDNLVFAKPGSQYRNDVTAESRWLTSIVNKSNIPTGYPPESLSRTDLLWILQPWVAANADLWSTIYSQTTTFPATISALLWAGGNLLPVGSGANNLFKRVAYDTVRLGFFTHQVEFKDPGDAFGVRTYNVTPEAISYEFDQQKVIATVGFLSRDAWDAAYTLANGLFTLDGDAAHGLDGTGILAP